MPGVVFEAERPREVAEFWAALLGGELVGDGHDGGRHDGGRLRVRLPDGPTVHIVGATAEKSAKNRIHLDLASDGDGGTGRGTQQAIVDRAIRLGAVHIDIGQYAGPVPAPWYVLADPAGNEFCVLEPRGEYTATGALAAVVIESPDPHRLAEFWSGATWWPTVRTAPELVSLRAPEGRGPWLELLSADPCPPVTPRCRLELTVPASGRGSTATATGTERPGPMPETPETPGVSAAPATEAPATEAPATEAPATEAPATEAPTRGAPTRGAPTAGAPTAGAPATGAPATGASATGAPGASAARTSRSASDAPDEFAAEADRLCLLGATRRGAGRLLDPDGTVIDLVPRY
ncbi:VOC family protein [Prauserella sediminis]|nr:VOC family protein [Prauserella sediminis]